MHSLARRETRQRSKVHELLRSASVLHSVKRYNAIGDPVSRCRPENHRRLLTLLKSDTINSIYISSPLFFLSLFYSLCFLSSFRGSKHTGRNKSMFLQFSSNFSFRIRAYSSYVEIDERGSGIITRRYCLDRCGKFPLFFERRHVIRF